MDRKLLGRRIREERLRIGLTQEQIAEKLIYQLLILVLSSEVNAL